MPPQRQRERLRAQVAATSVELVVTMTMTMTMMRMMRMTRKMERTRTRKPELAEESTAAMKKTHMPKTRKTALVARVRILAKAARRGSRSRMGRCSSIRLCALKKMACPPNL